MIPFISIVTINYNNKDGLRKTMNSVFNQDSINYEYIIIDGNSSDGGAEMIADFLEDTEKRKQVAFWCSEKDSGIWDAMNKGVSHANGKYILMLNSGDVLVNNYVISRLEKMNYHEDILYSDTNCVTSHESYKLEYPDIITSDYFRNGSTLGHQNALISTELSKKIPYHLDYKFAGDIVFFIECIIVNKCSYRHIDIPISNFDAETGCSSIAETKNARFDEWVRIWQTYFPGKIQEQLELLNEYESGYHGVPRRVMKLCRKLSFVRRRMLNGR